MALPNGVTVPSPLNGRVQYVTQRGYFAPPYVSCMFAALCSILIWEGYELPLARNADYVPPENFVWTLHKNSGAPLDGGTTIQHTKNAMTRLLPDAPMYYGAGTPAELITLLNNNAAIRVTAKCSNLPLYLRKHVGESYTGSHAFSIIGAKVEGGVQKVFWMDPMGRPSQYSGIWITWSDVSGVLTKNSNGKIIITYGYKNTVVDPSPAPPVEPDPEPEPDPVTEPDVDPPPAEIDDPGEVEGETIGSLTSIISRQRGIVAAGTPALHPTTLAILYYFNSNTTVRVFGITDDGLYRAAVPRTAGTEGTNPKYVLVPADAITGLYID